MVNNPSNASMPKSQVKTVGPLAATEKFMKKPLARITFEASAL